MHDIKTMRNLKPPYNKSLIFTRLGYDKNRTELSTEIRNDVERLLTKTENILDITAAYRIVNILEIKAPRVMLEDNTLLVGQKLSELLKNCEQALLMLATGGKGIMEHLARLQKVGNMSEAVIVDAAASEITDAALDVVMASVAQQLRPKGLALTRMRFSPGYGDFDITQQADFFRLLKAESYGLTLNDAYLLIPEKSVFAIAGIGGAG